MSILTLSFKGKTLKVYPIIEGEMLIGNNKICTVFIDSLAISENHAKISTSAQQSTLISIQDESGTYVNQKKINSHQLLDGDLIRVGKHTLLYNFKKLADEELMYQTSSNHDAIIEPQIPELNPEIIHRSAWVQILSGHNLGQTLQLQRTVTNLGKPGVAMVVIARRNNGYFISHLEGKFSPRVGDQDIGSESYKLTDGDLIQIGNIKMQFYLD